jgi:hypothetical protein
LCLQPRSKGLDPPAAACSLAMRTPRTAACSPSTRATPPATAWMLRSGGAWGGGGGGGAVTHVPPWRPGGAVMHMPPCMRRPGGAVMHVHASLQAGCSWRAAGAAGGRQASNKGWAASDWCLAATGPPGVCAPVQVPPAGALCAPGGSHILCGAHPPGHADRGRQCGAVPHPAHHCGRPGGRRPRQGGSLRGGAPWAVAQGGGWLGGWGHGQRLRGPGGWPGVWGPYCC